MCGLPAGVAAVGAEVTDIGVVTTPELHFTVQTYNQYHALEEQAYFTNLLEAFRCDHTPKQTPTVFPHNQQCCRRQLSVDSMHQCIKSLAVGYGCLLCVRG
jgi:hypothetical protein